MKRIAIYLIIITITALITTGVQAAYQDSYMLFALEYETWHQIKDCPNCTSLIDWQTIPTDER